MAVRFEPALEDRLKRSTCRDGQRCRLWVEVLPPWRGCRLLALVVEPPAGFRHFVANPQECVENFGPYHVSLCQAELATTDDVARLEAAFEGHAWTLPTTYVGNTTGYQELGACAATQHPVVRRLHEHPEAIYGGTALHISG